MGTRERPGDRGRRRARDAIGRLGRDHRDARVAAGLSLRACAAAIGVSHTQLWRFEQGELECMNVADVGASLAVVGLDLAMRAYPAGDPIRDAAQLALLERLRVRVHPELGWRTEVPLPIEGDLRAWDAEIRARRPERWRVRVEAETRVADVQALERRLARKLRDDPGGHVVLLLSETRANRRALPDLQGLHDRLPAAPRGLLADLGAGREPSAGGILLL